MSTKARTKLKTLQVMGTSRFHLPHGTSEFQVTADDIQMCFDSKRGREYVNFKDSFTEYNGVGSGVLTFRGNGTIEIISNVC